MVVYTASPVDIPPNDPEGYSESVVKVLMNRYLDKGHIFYADNWYTSPSRSSFLHSRNTGSCGTVRKGRKYMPKFGGQTARRTCERQKCQPMLSVRWTDKREVFMLSTFHKGSMVDAGKVDHRTRGPIFKPDIVLDYTRNMKLIDKSDAQIGAVECVRRTVKWYRKYCGFTYLMWLCSMHTICKDSQVVKRHHLDCLAWL